MNKSMFVYKRIISLFKFFAVNVSWSSESEISDFIAYKLGKYF